MASNYFQFIGPPEHVTEEAILWEIAFPFKRSGPEGSGLPEKDWWNHLHDFRITYTWELNIAETRRHAHFMTVPETGREYQWPDHLKRQRCTLPIRGPDRDPNIMPWRQDWFAFPLGLTNSRFDGPAAFFSSPESNGFLPIDRRIHARGLPHVLGCFLGQKDGNRPREMNRWWRIYADASTLLLGPSFDTLNSEEPEPSHQWEEADYMLILQNCIKAPEIPDDMPINSFHVPPKFELWIKVENQTKTRTFFNKKLMPIPRSYEWVHTRGSDSNLTWTDRSPAAFDGVSVHTIRGNPKTSILKELDLEFLIPMTGHGKGTWTVLAKILSEGGTIRRLARKFRDISPEGQQWLVRRQEELKDWLYTPLSLDD
ncbi:hypothetical protein N0V85_004986 [Neurospora sp. IMI 360204]|nr:hypothetical protein N0V85_004986 [Neurospora sp. IMI 360204]